MTTYDPALDREKIRQAIETVHQTLRDRLGGGVTLQQVVDKFNEVYGLGWTLPNKFIPCLERSRISPRWNGSSQAARR